MPVHRERPSLSVSRLSLDTPPGFNFWRTVFSHGWCVLPPFSMIAKERLLHRVLDLSDRTLVHCNMSASRGQVAVVAESREPLSPRQRSEIRRQLRTCLRMDENFAEFHAEARRHPEYRWIARSHAGRLLRTPTMFEDVVKMICTTNCTWALTTLMITNLVRNAGARLADGLSAFPEPAAIAAMTEREMRSSIKAGYRSPYLIELAQRVASGELAIESWRNSDLPTDLLFKEMRSVKGIGPYAAGNLLKLAGRYDELGLDSWVRAQFFKMHRNGRRVKDATINRHYAPLGKWRGLFFWMEMTKTWHDGQGEEALA